MENGVRYKTEEGSPQGGNLSPLLANIYLDKFDKEFEGRGVKVIRYADDIVLLAKSKRASERLLETSARYLEKKLKLKVNTEKSRAVSVYSIRNFKFLGFAMGRNRKGAYIRVHPKSRKKAKDKLRRLTSRSQGRKLDYVLHNIKVYMQGWLNYYGVAEMKSTMEDWNGWLRRRIRMYIPEAVEEDENKGRKPKEIRNARMAGLPKRKHTERILGCCRKRNIKPHHYKRKTCTPRIL